MPSLYLPKSIPLIEAFFARAAESTGIAKRTDQIIAIIGPTATGKSDLAVDVAIYIKNTFNKNCEIISADSRQIYRHLNIGTGKITKEEMRGIPHHLLDIHDPLEVYTVVDFQRDANIAIEEIRSRGNLPIICGGTGQYVDAVIYDEQLPNVPPNPKLRAELEKLTLEDLLTKFEELNKDQPHQVDIKNKRRIIRAIEILKTLGHIPHLDKEHAEPVHDTLIIGIDSDDATLRNRIKTRLEKRIDAGMIEESKTLLDAKLLTPDRMSSLGLEYAYILDLIDEKLILADFKEALFFAIWHYAKRQRTWFRKSSRVFWINNILQ